VPAIETLTVVDIHGRAYAINQEIHANELHVNFNAIYGQWYLIQVQFKNGSLLQLPFVFVNLK